MRRCFSASSTSSRSASAPPRSHTMGPMVAAGALPRRAALGRRPHPRRRRAGAARLPAARQPRLHRQGPRDRPGGDPRPRRLRSRRLRRGPGRGGAGRDRRDRRVAPAGPAARWPSTRRGPRLRLRPAAARPCQRHGAVGLGRRRQPASAARPTIRSAAASCSTARELGRPPRDDGGPRGAASVRDRGRDAGAGRGDRARIAAMQRANELARRGAAGARRRARPALGGDVGHASTAASPATGDAARAA